jgi:hypothetical protein
MAITVKHLKVSTVPDAGDDTLVEPSDWNADHTLTGTIDIANGGTGQTTANAAFNALAPSQTGNTGKYLTTDGTNSSWSVNPLGTVTSVAATAGTGISVTGSPITTSGTLNITNTAPDQTVVLTAGTGISTSGTYPNFTITNTSPSLGGDVVGPASATDNAIARFDSTTGKLLQNSVVTVGDTGATTGITTLSASTSVTTPIVQATNSAGLALRNSAGTTQISMGGGGGDNVTIAVATNINGANAQIDISPTGTGHVHIKPSGSGAVEIAPINAGTMNNMVIGGTTPLAITGTAITGTTITATSFVGSGASLTNVVNSLAASTGISVSGSTGAVTVTNTAPDQTVALASGTGISVTGTYPNFTVTNTAPSSGGTVTSVTGTAPVVSSGGNTPAISMAAATGSVNGYLTSTDWNTFNNKTSNTGTVTSVGGTGTVNGLTLTGTVTTTGNLTLGGTLDLSSPPAIGGTTAAAGKFTTLEATGVTTVQAGTASAPAITTSGDTNTGIFFPSADTIAFTEGGNEAMRIDSNARMLLNTTTVRNGAQSSIDFDGNAAGGMGVNDSASANGSSFIAFLTGGTFRGGINNVANTAVSYNTTSDYRLKENIAPMTGALAKVTQLKPCTYIWKETGDSSQGFIAHELAEVCPDCVTGEKDAVDADGNPKYQGVDTSFLVATLTAAIQELKAEFDAYKASHP